MTKEQIWNRLYEDMLGICIEQTIRVWFFLMKILSFRNKDFKGRQRIHTRCLSHALINA